MMLEPIYKLLAGFFRTLTSFFNDRAELLHIKRMHRVFPVGSQVRIVCDCTKGGAR